MKKLVGTVLLFAILAFVGTAGAQQEVKFVFEAGSLDHVLELAGIADPSVGSLTFTYVVKGNGTVAFGTRGVRPGLREVNDAVLYRLANLISRGTMRVTAEDANQFRKKYLFGRAVFEDRRTYPVHVTAKRFGIPEEKVGQWIESYLSVHGGEFKPFPLQPGTQI